MHLDRESWPNFFSTSELNKALLHKILSKELEKIPQNYVKSSLQILFGTWNHHWWWDSCGFLKLLNSFWKLPLMIVVVCHYSTSCPFGMASSIWFDFVNTTKFIVVVFLFFLCHLGLECTLLVIPSLIRFRKEWFNH